MRDLNENFTQYGISEDIDILDEGSYQGKFGFRGKKFAEGSRDAEYVKYLGQLILDKVSNNAGELLNAIEFDMNGQDFADFLENICDRLHVVYNYDEFDK